MLEPGEYADVLRAIGWTLDQRLSGRDVERIEVAVRGAALMVSWSFESGAPEHERYGAPEIEKLRIEARALREGRAAGPPGEQAEGLRTIGQQLDEQRIILDRLVKLPTGHHLIGTLNSRSFGNWYGPETLREMSAERRGQRAGQVSAQISIAESSQPLRMPVESLDGHVRALAESGKYVSVVWQEPESIAFVARGREYRSEFHIDPSDELMYMIRGEMQLHYRTPDGQEQVTVLPEGSVIFTPAGTPHSPHFAPDAFVFVTERPRAPGQIDRFQWFCPECDAFLHEEQFMVDDYRADPVSAAYRHFYDNEEFRTCKTCGAIMPDPRVAP
jgi:3-hydroxyanthranilate 3,4-dioxygenase